MTTLAGFDNEKYLREQTAEILERVARFNNKLFLEFGGKLMFDYHAARVLPGYDPNVKMRLLQELKEKLEIILCIYAGDIERKKIRADFGITYDVDALKLIDDLRERGIERVSVVVTRFDSQPSACAFKNRLERRGVKVYTHRATRGYPTDVDLILSDEGYGANPYIETTQPLVVVTGPGPGSGKLATCLSQLYHDHVQGRKSGYAKFETFPIWNLPLKHPVNIAYEVATADLGDYNQIDPFHLEAYGTKSINYNRDVDAFPLLKAILDRVSSADGAYQSPTDMGVNRAGFGIVNDEVVREASRQEILRRYFRYACEYALGMTPKETVTRTEMIMYELGLKLTDRAVVQPARDAADAAQHISDKGHNGVFCGAAIVLKDGTIIQGKNSPLMHAAASVVMNAVKHLAGIPDKIHLLPPTVIEAISRMKHDVLGTKQVSLNLEETLIALTISGTMNPTSAAAVEKLKELRGCEMHSTHIPTPGDEAGLRQVGLNVTSDPDFATKSLFIT